MALTSAPQAPRERTADSTARRTRMRRADPPDLKDEAETVLRALAFILHCTERVSASIRQEQRLEAISG